MVTKLFQACMAVASVTAATGLVLEQPKLVNTGMNMGLASGLSYAISDRQRKATEQKLASLNAIDHSQAIERKLATIDETLNNQTRQIDYQRERYYSTNRELKKFKKRYKQQAAAIAKQVDKLITLTLTDDSCHNNLPPSRSFVYVDGNNFRDLIEELNLNIDYAAFKNLLAKNEQTIFKFYDGVSRTANYSQRRLHNKLQKLGFEVVALPKVERSDGSIKTIGDDMQIGIDILTDVKPGDEITLVSGDGDFFPVLSQIVDLGVEVTVISSKGRLSHKLKDVSDRIIDLKEIADRIVKPCLNLV